MAENETTQAAEEAKEETKAEATEETTEAAAAEETAEPVEAKAEAIHETEDTDEISYHAVEKEGEISAIWEMQGKKHIRTISARSAEGQKILSLFTSEIHETDSPPMAGDATAS
ncbi:MAG: hypothetical protein IPM63_11005 [Acidobacteriota bacterium]|nr:MAG: hypothetical protein IPM63_11005 [Acidobacteriota bacterium]